jgi:3-methyl-2-oxobutanoate hydroxymethyltransferase
MVFDMSERRKITINSLMKKKVKGEKIVWLVVYDWPMAVLADQVGVDMLLVGDSVAMTMLGYSNTLPMTMGDMIHHARAVTRGAKYAFIVGDMPFMSYQTGVNNAIRNAGRFMKVGCDAVKLEGGAEMADIVRAVVNMGIPVIGHLGLTPQRASMLGGYTVQGRDAETAKKLITDAITLEKAGAMGVLLENVPTEVGTEVRKETSILTLGIGCGPDYDGQCLLSHDVLGLTLGVKPKFAKQYVDLKAQILDAFTRYRDEVIQVKYPSEEYLAHMKEGEYEKLQTLLRNVRRRSNGPTHQMKK